MYEYKGKIRDAFGTKYNHELLNNLFNHPYTKIEFIQNDLSISRFTASKYLDLIVELKLLSKIKIGTSNYYINDRLVELLMNQGTLHE